MERIIYVSELGKIVVYVFKLMLHHGAILDRLRVRFLLCRALA